MTGTTRHHVSLAHAAGLVLGVCMATFAHAQMVSVINSPHDLSAGSTARIRAASEDQVCIFCHTPHNASPAAPLWNRLLSPAAYSIYTSRALNAKPGQPTGSSKLCLSCHDGTIALGSVLSRGTPIQMSGGVIAMPAGASNLGTDLRDDHPISFAFDTTLAAKDVKLRSPATLPPEIKLDSNRELQCTTCHDAHNNAFGKFLVKRNTNSELCISCHTMGTTDITGHANCSDCHQSHTAPSGPYLLKRRTISQTCNSCHDGTNPQALNVSADTHKAFAHDNDPAVDPATADNVSLQCANCHEPHTMTKGVGATPPQLTGPRRTAIGRLGKINGVNTSGSAVTVVSAEQEVCYKCHGDGNPLAASIPRRQPQTNMRLQFASNAISYHPVGTMGRSSEVPSLKPGWSTSSTMACSDCHASDTGTTSGIHGSTNAGLLVSRLVTTDRTSESATNYALCYRCHDRNSILGDKSFKEHKKHIVEERTPCTVCHDSHGIASTTGTLTGNSRLINFDTRVVTGERSSGRIEFRDTGSYRGQCFLSCHGENHNGLSYAP
ncbi:MAG: cytochrome c3 family protein [Planctomycetota bacterium]|nr:cytochrome c3 family protein [Planctomycetota bacterium]